MRNDPLGAGEPWHDLHQAPPSPSERELDDIFAPGVDAEALLEQARPKATLHNDGTFTVVGFDLGRPEVDVRIHMLRETPNLRPPFAEAIALRARAANVRTLQSFTYSLARFVDFLRDKHRLRIRLSAIDDELLDQYRDWLDDYITRSVAPPKKRSVSINVQDGGRKLAQRTKISRMNALLVTLRALRAHGEHAGSIQEELDLIRSSDWSRSRARSAPTKILTRPQMKALVRICRREVVETTTRLQSAWRVMEGQDQGGDDLVDPVLLLEVLRLHEWFKGRPPIKTTFHEHFPDYRSRSTKDHPFPRLRSLSVGSYSAALAFLYPTGRLLMPFVLLFAIYYRFNRSVVTALKASDLREQPSPHGSRLVGQKFKNRANRFQVASWPVTADLHNPAVMRETLVRWTSLIRPDAPEGSESHLFLERAAKWRTRSLADTYAFNLAFRDFLSDNEAQIGARFGFRSLRPTVIDLVHHLFDGDLLATAEAGQHQVQTLIDHYLSDAARKRNDETLIPAAHAMNGWMRSDGLVDDREDRRRGSRSAATPGFECDDRYASTVPGQRPDVYCTAYGMCGSCIHGHAQTTSPDAFALVWQLRQAMLRSRTRMPAETWLARWAPVLDRLDTYIIPSFPRVVADRADLDIPMLPTVE